MPMVRTEVGYWVARLKSGRRARERDGRKVIHLVENEDAIGVIIVASIRSFE